MEVIFKIIELVLLDYIAEKICHAYWCAAQYDWFKILFSASQHYHYIVILLFTKYISSILFSFFQKKLY